MPNLPLLSKGNGGKPSMVIAEPQSIYGYQIRTPFAGEDKFFKSRPEVGGMAAEDGKIVLNPYSSLKDEEKMQVAKNEAIRLWMRDNKTTLPFEVTKDQTKAFSGTEYGSNPQALKETIVARFLTGDKSAMATPEQQSFANKIMERITKSTQTPTTTQSIMSSMGMKTKPLAYNERIKVFPTKHPFVKNPDGSISNVILSGEDIMNEAGLYDHTIAFPTMVNGFKHTKDEAYHIAKGEGLENYPKFKSVKEMNEWAKKNHGNIDEKGYLVKPKKSMVEIISEAIKMRPIYKK